MFQTANALPVQSAKSATKTVAYVAARLALMVKNATNVKTSDRYLKGTLKICLNYDYVSLR